MNLPQVFINNVTTTWPQKGPQWLAQLPQLIAQITKLWQLQNVQQFENLSFNYVAKAVSLPLNKTVALKLSVESIEPEFRALQVYNGNGCVRVLMHDVQLNALLLEHLTPGTDLKSFFHTQDAQAIEITAGVIQKLHACTLYNPERFPTITNAWLHDLFDLQGPQLPSKQIEIARAIAQGLLESTRSLVLLHGDLHHENILHNGEEWIAIDPKGFIGDPAFEPVSFIKNPIGQLEEQSNNRDIIKNRIEFFAQLLNLDKQRIAKWCYVQAILDAVWDHKDGKPWQQHVEFAQLFLIN